MKAPIPFVGPSYELANRKADSQRTINMFLKKIESGSGKAQYILESIPGCDVFNGQVLGDVRGMLSTLGGRAFAVVGDQLLEVFEDSSVQVRGTLSTTLGRVSIALGREHAVIVDGTDGYSFEFATDTFTTITDPDFYGSNWVAYLAGRFVFGRPGFDQFYWSDIDDPLSYDALDFATAESSPDGLVWGIDFREELWLFGNGSIEVWTPSSSADAAFERNRSVSISVGCAAGHTVTRFDNSLAWLGHDDNGPAVPYMVQGYSPRRIGRHAVEEVIQTSTDLDSSYAYSFQRNGQVFWCINCPGLETTWVYEVTTGEWYEWAEYFSGSLSQHRFNSHMMAFGSHVFGSVDTANYEGRLYTFGDHFHQENSVGGAADSDLIRERVSPHYAAASMEQVFYSRFRLDCAVGELDGPKYVQLYYSNDGGFTYTASAMQRSLGETGERRTMVQWNRLGSGRDRVWKLRCTDDVRFDIVDVKIEMEVGSA